MTRILGIETSCDETAIGVVEDGTRILSSAIASSQHLHSLYGGVIPDIAGRIHVERIWQVLEEALDQAKCQPQDLDAIAVTYGPGLPGALLIGLAFAKGLALSLKRPLLGVDHLAAHLYAARMHNPELEPPYLGLIVSGGHTILCGVHTEFRFEVLGETKDDAIGEAFDKVARLLGLGYPGGPVIDRLSEEGERAAIPFPRATAKESYDFSFSGLKTAVYNHVRHLTKRVPISSAPHADEATASRRAEPRAAGQAWLDHRDIANIAASFQEAAVEMVVSKTLKACHRTGTHQLAIGGGVAANRRLRERLTEEASTRGIRVVCPPPSLCMDNGPMVAGWGFELLRKGRGAPLTLSIDPNLRLN